MSESTRSMGAHDSIGRSALLLAVCVTTTSLLLLPVTFGREGASGPLGLVGAAIIILLTGLAAEAISFALRHSNTVAAPLAGMTVRMLPPLAVCAILAAQDA